MAMVKTAIKPQYGLYLASLGLLTAVYFAGGKLGLTLSSVEGIVTLVWPPTGIALAALLLFGHRLWPGVALGAFLVNISAGAPLLAALGISVGNTLEAVVGAYLLRQLGFRGSLERLQDVLNLVGPAAVISTMVSATIGTASLGLTGVIPWTAYGSTWWVWWLGDALGALVVAPVLLTWGTLGRLDWPPQRLVEAVAFLGLLVIASQVAFGGWFAPHMVDVRLSFTLLPFLVWAALRFGQRGAVLATLIGTGMAVWGTAHGFGPFVLETVHLSLIFLGSFMGAAAVTAMLLAAAIAERQQVEQALRQSQDRLAGIVNSAMDAIITVDAEQRIILFNQAAEQMFNYAAASVIGKPLDLFIPDQFRLLHQEYIRNFGHNGVTSRAMGALGAVRGLRAGGEEFPIEASISQIESAGQKLYTVILRDITERKQAEQAQRLLAEVGSLLTTSLDIDVVVTGLLHLIVPALADWAVIDLVEANGSIRRLGRIEVNPAQAELADRLDNYPPDPTNHAHPVIRVLRSGQPEIISNITDEILKTISGNAEHLNLSHQLKAFSALIVPLTARGQPIGTLSFLGLQLERRPYSQADLPLAKELAHRVALAIDNVRLYQGAQSALEAIQMLNEQLEQRVADRTAQLKATNKKLAGEISERQRISAELAEIQHRLVESLDQERITLAQELHDGPVQELYGVFFGLNGLAERLANEAELAQLTAVQHTIEHTIQMLRTMFTNLRPPSLAPYGLEKAIRSHTDEFQAGHAELKIGLDLLADGQVLPERMRLILFRIYQEALNNVVRHAQAQQVWIRFTFDQVQAILEIRDDGCGFEVPQRWVELARQGHLGLVGMVERTQALDGEFQLNSRPGAGTLIRVIVPIFSELEAEEKGRGQGDSSQRQL